MDTTFKKKIAAVVPVFNRVNDTINCITKLKSLTDEQINIDIILVDDGSTDGTSSLVSSRFADIKILLGDGNLWWTGGVNKGLKYINKNIECDYILLLNNDTNFNKHTLQNLINVLHTRSIKTVCSSTVIDEESGKIYNMGQKFSGFFKELKPIYKGDDISEHKNEIVKCDSIGTRFVLMPKRIINDVGLFDEKHFPHGYSDFDYFIRSNKKNYQILTIADSIIYTTQNRNYFNYQIITSSLLKHLSSFFDIKSGNNLRLLFYNSTMHRPLIIGIFLFIKKMLSHIRWIIYKILLPQSILQKIITKKWII